MSDASSWASLVAGQLDSEVSQSVPSKRRGRKKKDGEDVLGKASEDSPDGRMQTMRNAFQEAEQSIFVMHNTAIEEQLKEPPKPFIEPEGPKPYSRDGVDDMLPEPGFLTDYVNTGRGMEAPTLHLLWSCLWTLSSILKREAWLRWYPKPLWPNLYVLIVAPPALCRKSSSMDIGVELLRQIRYHLPSSLDAYKKDTKILTGKTTPEGLLTSLAPEQRTFYDRSSDGSPSTMHTVDKGSIVALAISELAMFLGKQQYNQAMVTTLTDLFDCKVEDAEITRGHGLKPLKDIYVTLIGGVTPDGLKLSIPEEAFGGGFMSRLILAYQDIPTKIYAMPKILAGYPQVSDLLPKLAWIAMNARGEYYLTPEAEEEYDRWYKEWKTEIFSRSMDKPDEFRLDGLILRVALLLRVQEYRKGHDITVANINDARRLLTYTIRTAKRATEDVGATLYVQHMNTIKAVLRRRGCMSRRELSQYMSSRGSDAQEITNIVDQLMVEGYLRIMYEGAVLEHSSGSGKEIYEILEEQV